MPTHLLYFRLVKVAMDALDQLLVSCHDYSLNLFVESFLKMVHKLLECDELELQILATLSVSNFSIGQCERVPSPSLFIST